MAQIEQNASKGGESEFLNICKQILEKKESRDDRTGVGTYSMFSPKVVEYDLTNGQIPCFTTKKVAWKSAIKELLWFISGSTDSKELEAQGIPWWVGNTSREFLDKKGLTDYKVGELGACFPEDTPTLTKNGYINIQDVKVDDLVYTHKGNWKKVTDTFQRQYSGPLFKLKVRYIALSIIATPEHPFYIMEYDVKDRRNSIPRALITYKDPIFMEVKNINKKCLIGMKIEEKQIIPQLELSKYKNQNVENEIVIKTLDNHDEWFMMGYFLGDGCVVNEKNCNRIVFAINDKQKIFLVPRLRKVLNITKSRQDQGCSVYRTTNALWSQILMQFGKYAYGKKIPDWVHRAPNEYIQSFLEGYFAADGCMSDDRAKNNTSYRLTTISRDNALSVQRLYLKLGKFASVSFQKRGYKKIINDIECNIKDCYFVEVYDKINKKSSQSCIKDGYAWFSITKIEKLKNQELTVYNFSVKDHETYTVNNMTVHNCYGWQWRKAGATYIPGLLRDEKNIDIHGQGGVDQLAEVIHEIKTNPHSRRLVVTAYIPQDLGIAVLPPCHSFFQFYVSGQELSCTLYQRSADMFLGAQINILSYSVLTHMIAKITGLTAKSFYHHIGDAHIYKNHVNQMMEQLQRPIKSSPQLVIKDRKQTIDDFVIDDFDIVNYDPAPFIKAPMAV